MRIFIDIVILISHFFYNIYGKSSATLILSNLPPASPFSTVSPKYYGVNLGHKCSNDTSWVAFLKYLSPGRVRFFGVGGVANTLSIPKNGLGTSVSKVTNSYGSSLSGFMVRNILLRVIILFINIAMIILFVE